MDIHIGVWKIDPPNCPPPPAHQFFLGLTRHIDHAMLPPPPPPPLEKNYAYATGRKHKIMFTLT